MRSNEMHGFLLALRLSLQGHRQSTCCFVGGFYHVGCEEAENPCIPFDLMREVPVSGKTARRGVAAAPARARGGNYLKDSRPPYVSLRLFAALLWQLPLNSTPFRRKLTQNRLSARIIHAVKHQPRKVRPSTSENAKPSLSI